MDWGAPMISLARMSGRLPLMAFALALAVSGYSTPSAMALGGSDGMGLWGEYGYGPHLGGYHGIAYGKPFYGGYGMVYGYPKHRKVNGCGVPGYGGTSPGCGYPYHGSASVYTDGVHFNGNFGMFTGAPTPPPMMSLENAAAEAAAESDKDRAKEKAKEKAEEEEMDPSATDPGIDPGGEMGEPADDKSLRSPKSTSAPKNSREFGIDEEAIVEANGVRAMKVTRVYPGTVAETAGIRRGDVIYSINGFLTEQQGNLTWILANASPNNTLKLTVRSSRQPQGHIITALVP